MIGQFPLDEQIHIDNLTQHWDRFMSAADDREQSLHAEIARLQRLQRLAEKVHKDTKLFEGYLDDVEQKLNEVSEGIQVISQSTVISPCTWVYLRNRERYRLSFKVFTIFHHVL